MQHQSKKITYGAMMLALFMIFMVGTIFIPIFGLVFMIFIPLPIALYRLHYDRSSTSLLLLIGIGLSLVIGGLVLLPFAVIHGILGFLIAEMIQLGKSKLYTFMASALFLIILGVVLYLAAAVLLDVNAVDSLLALLKESEQQFKASLSGLGISSESYVKIVEEAFVMYRTAIPAFFILTVYAFAYFIVIPNFEVLRRLGHQVPKFSPFREMRLPFVTILIYGLIILLPFIMKIPPDSTAYLLYVNAMVILRPLLLLQGFAFIHYVMHKMKMPGVVTFFTTIIAFVFSPITIFLGIVDIGVNIRAFIGKDNLK